MVWSQQDPISSTKNGDFIFTSDGFMSDRGLRQWGEESGASGSGKKV
jgi:hypothetical protein